MSAPQRGQKEVDNSKTSTQRFSPKAYPGIEKSEEEYPTKPPMWSNLSKDGQRKRGGQNLDITNENTPRYQGYLNYSGFEIPPLETGSPNYTFGPTPSSITTKRQEIDPEIFASESLGLDKLSIYDNTGIGLAITSHQDKTSHPRKNFPQDVIANLSDPPIVRCDTRPATGKSSDDAHAGYFKVDNAMRSEGHDMLDREETIHKLISVAEDQSLDSVSEDLQREISHSETPQTSHEALAVDENSSEASLMPDTDTDSDEEWPARGILTNAEQHLEQQGIAFSQTSLSQWKAKFTARADCEGSASTSNTASRSGKHSASTSSSSNHSRKQASYSHNGHPANEDDDPPIHPDSDISEPQGPKVLAKLACPFVKHNPVKYNAFEYHTCATNTWPSISRLKGHIGRSHKAPIYCKNCKQIFETTAALEFHHSNPDAEFSGWCSYRNVPEPEGMTLEMEKRLKERWRGASDQEKWTNIYNILFPGELVPEPDFDTAPAIAIPVFLSQTQHTQNLEEPFRPGLSCALRKCFDQSANQHIKSLPETAKAEIVKDLVEECVLQLTLSKISPNETPRMLAPPKKNRAESQDLSMDEQIMEASVDSCDSSGGESSNQGLGLALDSGGFFNEEYMAWKDSEENQWSSD